MTNNKKNCKIFIRFSGSGEARHLSFCGTNIEPEKTYVLGKFPTGGIARDFAFLAVFIEDGERKLNRRDSGADGIVRMEENFSC